MIRQRSQNSKNVIIIGITTLAVVLIHSNARFTLQAQEATPGVKDAGQTAAEKRTAVRQAYLKDQQPAQANAATAATLCTGGSAGGYPCSNVDLLAYMPLNTIGGTSANDIWGWTDPQNGKEYALIGLNTGTGFIDISDPENPVYLGKLPTHTLNSSWRDIKVHANHAFIVSEAAGHGLQVFDLTRLRNVSSPPITFTADAHYNGVNNVHNIAINEATGFAYLVGSNTCSGGLHMIDINSPTNPTYAGCFSGDGYTHDAQCVIYNGPDVTYIGHEICFNANEDTITIVDVSDKSSPTQISRTAYNGNEYTHQAWLSEDQSLLFANDELDESRNGHNTRTYIWDISDLDAPPAPITHDSTTAAIDHNLYVRGNLMYQANYRAGLRILDTSDAANGNLTEIGYFDVYPSSDSANFNGTWSIYPYFDSDIVIASGIEQGLFILDPKMSPDFRMEAAVVELTVCGSGSAHTTLNLESLYGYNSSVTLSASGVPSGAVAGFSLNPLQPSGASEFSVTNTSAANGDYLLQVSASDGSISADEFLKLSIVDPITTIPTLLQPLENAVDVSPSPTLSWQAVTGAISYNVQIATDAQFNSIVDEAAGLTTNSYTPTLDSAARYYWRVRSSNGCSTSSYTAAGVFNTAPSIICTVHPSSDVPKSISTSGTPTISSIINVAFDETIGDVNILDLQGQHTYFNDLDFSLTSPEASVVQIMDRSCGSQNDFDLNLDDEAAPGGWPCPPTGGETYQPSSPLSTFDGQASGGNWTLTIYDNATNDGGSLDQWSLEICTLPPSQIIALDSGWNLISSYINPVGPNLEYMLAGIDDQMVLIKNGQGEITWPAYNINQIGSWDQTAGYAVYMQSAGNLTIYGDAIDPGATSSALTMGWNLAGYWRNSPMAIGTALDGISDVLKLVKNEEGLVYWPELGIFGIQNMQPGEGYQIYMNAGKTLNYPAN